mmetsp:Transcript_3848/g.9788  ORF Transcript_3848/g.9788 Transcript_3848/m.9788 type:complete len:147 (-) Transcript_3848:601-1041(-)
MGAQTKKSAAPPAPPPYERMVKSAIVALKDRTGSSAPAIAKYMAANYKLADGFSKQLSKILKRYVESGKLVKVKASYKLGSLKSEAKPKKKKVAPKKKTAAKKKVVKKAAPKKKVTKKPKKAAPKKKIAKKPKKAAPKKKRVSKKK